MERSLSSDDVSARYRAIEDEIREVIAWIEVQRDEIAAERIQSDTLRTLHDRTSLVIDAAARAWPDEVRADSARYPYSRSAAHPA